MKSAILIMGLYLIISILHIANSYNGGCTRIESNQPKPFKGVDDEKD